MNGQILSSECSSRNLNIIAVVFLFSIGKMGTLTVRTHEKEDDKIEGSSIGTSAVLELSQNTTKFFIGGLPQDAEASEFV